MKLSNTQKSFFLKTIPISAFIAGLCCFSPIILVLVGLSSLSTAASLADILYGTYKWVFRGVALLFLLIAIFYHINKTEKICSIDEIKKHQRKIINLILITIIGSILAYVIWLYVILEIIGILLGIWK